VLADHDPTLSVAEAARLLGRDRTRVYALLRAGDLIVAEASGDDAPGPVRIDRSSVERWLVAGSGGGRPLSWRNAWALIGLASGDGPFSARSVGLLEHPEELSRARARLTREKLVDLAPRLRRRATLVVRQVPTELRAALEEDAALVRTGVSAAGAYGWNALTEPVDADSSWRLDAYLSLSVFDALQEHLNRLDLEPAPAAHANLTEDVDAEAAGTRGRDTVLLRVVEHAWPFPPHYPLAPQPLAAMDLLDYPSQDAQRVAREVLNSLNETHPSTLARRSARARAMSGPLAAKIVALRDGVRVRARVEGDPQTDTRAAAAHMVAVLWATASQGLSVRELRATIGLSRERFEDAYEFLEAHPPLGLIVQRHGDGLRLVTAPEAAPSVERHLNVARSVALSRAALEVLAIVAYRQPIARSGVEFIRGSASDSALDTLLQRGLIEHNAHHLLVTTRGFLEYAGLRDVADLPPLGDDG
jgi:segregation and condensation protein B